MQLHRRQQPFDGLLVDHLVFKLGHDGVGDGGQLFHHPLIAALGIEFHDEVTTLHPDVGGIAIGLQQQTYFLGEVGGLGILNADIVDQTAHIVGLFQIGFDVEVATHANGEGLVHDAQLEEIGFGKVGTELGLEVVLAGEGGCQQYVCGDVAFEEGVMASDVDFAASLVYICLRCHVAQVQTAVLQLVEGGVGRQMSVLGEEVCAVAFGIDIGRKGIDRVFGHEVMQVQILDADVCIVAHQAGHHLSFGILRDGGSAL